jgi:exodeoxyribonuclease VII small subunit
MVARLEEIVRQLEGGQPTLAEAMALFSEGNGLCRQAESLLDQADALLNQNRNLPGEDS